MARTPLMGTDDRDAEVVVLPGDPPEPTPPSPPGRAHGFSIAGMAASALVGMAAILAYVTVNWTPGAGHVVVGIFLVAGLTFLVCASLAVFTAARDTYRDPSGRASDN
ncbi:MAG TPA: hypothetical protein VFK89_03855 [Actinomycetota bacterium]|nr:hypothetical protein [Actinomycetota bacterium]